MKRANFSSSINEVISDGPVEVELAGCKKKKKHKKPRRGGND